MHMHVHVHVHMHNHSCTDTYTLNTRDKDTHRPHLFFQNHRWRALGAPRLFALALALGVCGTP